MPAAETASDTEPDKVDEICFIGSSESAIRITTHSYLIDFNQAISSAC